MTHEHTPGPWAATVKENGDNLAVTSSDGAVVGGCGCCGSPWTDSKRAYANARLIAAAPDLLAALRGVLRVADRKTDEFDAARAAIARAETP